MEQHIIDTVRALRAELHGLAERSGKEKKTKARLMAFLREHTSLGLVDEGQWFCAIHKEPGACGTVAGDTVAFRADMDALPSGDGAAHLCGHDGHCAVLAGLGLWLEGKRVGKNIVLIFQHAEETGEGGKICARALDKYGVGRVYAFHNIPGWPAGAVLLCRGTFACASRGMVISMAGAPSHAAYPEYGRNPGFAAARLIAALPALTRQGRYNGPAMATLIGADIGGTSFGTAAGSAEVYLTLRAANDGDLDALIAAVKGAAEAEASKDGVSAAVSFRDAFPATVNSPAAADRLESVCRKAGLRCVGVPEPFRWSEDFGWYGKSAEAVMAGIGAGEDWPQLHTENYEFNDDILPSALMLFSALAEFG
ncbi:amidohydrolase [Sporobacter termitidis DSM 10068]|uniref:Amidohydrolase n=1 Tax=Sporobacter termitidis DSM 10068 TaxID=1123282 RepID=A0A1M5VJY1_9FIRM|nr:M20/M25/M40 family metallo-hydrolase [Sporobacter termitidis]SHH75515.1 amidohydrolase [Sporobacter termitidis DSM 10068]